MKKEFSAALRATVLLCALCFVPTVALAGDIETPPQNDIETPPVVAATSDSLTPEQILEAILLGLAACSYIP